MVTYWFLIICLPALFTLVHPLLANVSSSPKTVLILDSFTDRKAVDDLEILRSILFPAVLIAGLLWQRARKRNADLRLRESEERFRSLADSTHALIWVCDKKGTVNYLNDNRIDFTGPHQGLELATRGPRSFTLTTYRASRAPTHMGLRNRKSSPRSIGFAAGMECTDGCWRLRLHESIRMAFL